MFFYIYYAVVFALMGIIIGSFLNVCIYRIPLKETIVTVPSHCTHCNHKLAWYDLFPLFSYLFLGGKCRYCKEKISMQYPAIELLNGIAYLVTYLMIGTDSPSNVIYSIVICIFLSAMIVLAGIDITHQIVPDSINVFILIITIPVLILDRSNWLSHLIGIFAVSVPLLGIAMLTNGMGGGDIKLYAVCGLFLGWKLTLLSLFLTSVIASVFGIILMLMKKAKDGKKTRLPLVPFIAVSNFISIFWGYDLIKWYITTFFNF